MTASGAEPYEHIAYEVDADGVAVVTLDRPDARNAFTVTMANELLGAFDRIDADDAVRAVVVTGRGKAFCVGADLVGGADSLDMSKSPDTVADKERDLGGVVALRIFDCRKPVVGAINGSAAGIGITMTLPMDVRIGSEGAKVGFVFTGRGIPPDAASSWFLPRIVGVATALEWCLTAAVLPSEEALAAGLFARLRSGDEVLAEAMAVARRMATQASPVAASLTRHLLWRMTGAASPMVAHRIDSRLIAHTSQGPDAYEGITAFLEKRTPAWTGALSTDLPPEFPWWAPERFVEEG